LRTLIFWEGKIPSANDACEAQSRLTEQQGTLPRDDAQRYGNCLHLACCGTLNGDSTCISSRRKTTGVKPKQRTLLGDNADAVPDRGDADSHFAPV